MTEIILAGNPNAGKTTIFNFLTGEKRKTGNWHGVTVGACSARCGDYLVTDLPGVYALKAFSMEERLAAAYIESHKDAVFFNVADCANLDRSLRFTRALMQSGVKPVLILTKRAPFQRRGGRVDKGALSRLLGIPVLYAEELKREDLPKWIARAKAGKPDSGFRLTGEAFFAGDFSLSRAERWLVKPYIAAPFFLFLFAAAFFCAFYEGMAGAIGKEALTSAVYALADFLGAKISSALVRGLLCDCLIKSVGGVLGFLPQLAVLYLFLILLEESGLMSYAAFAFDDAFALVGLNGRAVFTLLMGFGCTAAAACTARGTENEGIRRRTVLALQFVPCSARLPVLLTVLSDLFPHPFFAVLLLYALSIALAAAAAYLMKGKEEEIFLLEIPPLGVPDVFVCLKSLLFQLKQFIIKIGTVMTGFLVGVWLLSSFSFSLRLVPYEESAMAFFCNGLRYLFYPMGIRDGKMALAALGGLAAKENIAGILALFYPQGLPFSYPSLAAFAVFVMLCPPCVSAFAACAKEVGKKSAALFYAAQTAASFIAAYAVYLFLSGGGAVVLSLVFALAALWFTGKICHERICRHRRNQLKKIHR